MLQLLSVEHRQQTERAGCLAACAQMALQHIGVHQSQAQLNHLLGLTPEGTPSSRVRRLSELGVQVVYASGDETICHSVRASLATVPQCATRRGYRSGSAGGRTLAAPHSSSAVEEAA